MTVIELIKKWETKTKDSFFNEFIEKFPTKDDFDNWLDSKDLSITEETWYPEGELFELNRLFDFDFYNSTEIWIDFFNELIMINW